MLKILALKSHLKIAKILFWINNCKINYLPACLPTYIVLEPTIWIRWTTSKWRIAKNSSSLKLKVHQSFLNGPTPASYCLFLLFSNTNFANFATLTKSLKAIGNFLNVHLVFGKLLGLLWQFFMLWANFNCRKWSNVWK